MIYLTEPKDLSAGLWWARQITGDRDLGRGPWLITQVTGVVPFLSARVVLRQYENVVDKWGEPNGELGIIDNYNSWEFGPRIQVPGDKDRAEYAPREAREKS